MNSSNRMPLQRPPNMSPQQFASTPTNQRFFLPRFGHSSIPSYPRPRSSASKPNPDCSPLLEDPFSAGPCNYPEEDSMRNNFGSSRDEDSFANGDSSFQSPNSSAYYSCYDSFVDSPAISPEEEIMNNPQHFDANTPQKFQQQNARTPQRFQQQNARTPQRFQQQNARTPQRFQQQNERTPQRFQKQNEDTYQRRFQQQNEDTYQQRFQQQNEDTYQGFQQQNKDTYQRFQPQIANATRRFQPQNANIRGFQPKSANNGFQNKFPNKRKNFVKNKPYPFKKNPVNNPQSGTKSVWQCSLCSITFTSGIPYEMHIKGVKHARKLKVVDADKQLQEKVKDGNGISASGSSFRCEVCGVQANSSLQFMTHIEGNKHKMKVAEATGNSTEPGTSKKKFKSNEKKPVKEEVIPNEKSNADVRRVEINSVENRPTFSRLVCDICCSVLNSDAQLQLHLASKKHQGNVEKKLQLGKEPIVPGEKIALLDPASENSSSTVMQQ